MCKATRIAEGHEGAGFSSPIALAHAMRTWAETHEFAMSYMANAAVVLHGKGVENTLNSPCAVFYPLASNRAPSSGDDDDSDNPATAFRLASFPTVISPDTPTGSYMREALEKGLADCKKVANMHRTVLPYHRSYAGVVAAIFMVNGTTHINQFCYPIYRIHQHNDCPLDHVPFVAWKHVMIACRQAVDTGRVLKAPDYSTRFQPHVGTYRRRGRKWIWVCSEEEDQAMASEVSGNQRCVPWS